jgi:hypothetical protein
MWIISPAAKQAMGSGFHEVVSQTTSVIMPVQMREISGLHPKSNQTLYNQLHMVPSTE